MNHMFVSEIFDNLHFRRKDTSQINNVQELGRGPEEGEEEEQSDWPAPVSSVPLPHGRGLLPRPLWCRQAGSSR